MVEILSISVKHRSINQSINFFPAGPFCAPLLSVGVTKVSPFFTPQVHDMEFAPNLDIITNETLPALQKVQQSGKARFIGITGFPVENFFNINIFNLFIFFSLSVTAFMYTFALLQTAIMDLHTFSYPFCLSHKTSSHPFFVSRIDYSELIIHKLEYV